jgi:alkanesulfonate monooxygenase SsuD/methylene tetrahydromethanopterin reductase-like flavin-dependent oxidoreductase (luciferase family)
MADPTKRSASSFRETLVKTQVYGTPEKVIETLRTISETMDAVEFVGVFKYGGMPLEVAQRSMKLFATKVLPNIQRDNTSEQRNAAAGR